MPALPPDLKITDLGFRAKMPKCVCCSEFAVKQCSKCGLFFCRVHYDEHTRKN